MRCYKLALYETKVNVGNNLSWQVDSCKEKQANGKQGREALFNAF